MQTYKTGAWRFDPQKRLDRLKKTIDAYNSRLVGRNKLINELQKMLHVLGYPTVNYEISRWIQWRMPEQFKPGGYGTKQLTEHHRTPEYLTRQIGIIAASPTQSGAVNLYERYEAAMQRVLEPEYNLMEIRRLARKERLAKRVSRETRKTYAAIGELHGHLSDAATSGAAGTSDPPVRGQDKGAGLKTE